MESILSNIADDNSQEANDVRDRINQLKDNCLSIKLNELRELKDRAQSFNIIK